MSAIASNQPSPQQLNAAARSLILQRGLNMEQQLTQQTLTAAAGQNISAAQPVLSIQPRNVGLTRGFWVQVVATVHNGSGVQIDLSDFGPMNVLSQIQFNDLANNTRIQTTGWHLSFINSIKARRPFGSSLVRTTGFASAINYGNNWGGQIAADATIAAGADGTITMWYWVPLAYSQNDLRGAIYLNVLNTSCQLNLTFNPAPVVDNGKDSTSAMYVGHSAGSTALAVISAVTVTSFQNYIDQLPTAQNGQVLLPVLDLATIYELKNTVLTGMVANQDFPVQYANYRDFLSLSMVYVNTATNGARGTGADINSWALQAANLTNIWKKPPSLIALQNRQHLQVDPPPGLYYFGSREKPIATTQYGNMQLVMNPLTVGTGAYMLMGYEDFGLVQTLSMAGSLAAS